MSLHVFSMSHTFPNSTTSWKSWLLYNTFIVSWPLGPILWRQAKLAILIKVGLVQRSLVLSFLTWFGLGKKPPTVCIINRKKVVNQLPKRQDLHIQTLSKRICRITEWKPPPGGNGLLPGFRKFEHLRFHIFPRWQPACWNMTERLIDSIWRGGVARNDARCAGWSLWDHEL